METIGRITLSYRHHVYLHSHGELASVASNNLIVNNFHAKSKFIGNSSLGHFFFLTISLEMCGIHMKSQRHMPLLFLIKKFCSITSEYFI